MAARKKTPRRKRIVCPTSGDAHAIRHELDKLGALSRRHGNVITTTGSRHVITKARRRARLSVHMGSSR